MNTKKKTKSAPQTNDSIGYLRGIIKKANEGKACSSEVQALLQTVPGLADIAGDRAKMAEAMWLKNTTGDNQLLKTAQEKQLVKLRYELGGDNPTPLEKLIIDRIIMCHLQVNFAELLFIGQIGSTTGLGSKGMDLHQRWLDRSQARLLSSIKTLALIRRLNLPPILLNLAKNQINVASLNVGDQCDEQPLQLEAQHGEQD